MRVLLLSSLVLVALDQPAGVGEPQPCRPAVADNAWQLYTSKRISANTTIESPNWPRLRGTRLHAGRFDLTVVQRWPTTADSMRRGTLEIGAPTRGRQTGTIDIDFQAWGIPGAAYSATSTDSSQPGVLVDRDQQDRVLLIVAGADMEDAGLLFAVFRVDSAGIAGMWASGAAVAPAPKGYFCAVRTG
jgi:hypothetical protein